MIHHNTSSHQMSAKGRQSSENPQVQRPKEATGARERLEQGLRIPHRKSGEGDRDVVTLTEIRCEMGHKEYGR
jgi:hypothetical protein